MAEQSGSPIAHVYVRELDTAGMPTLDVRHHPGKEQIRGALRYDPKALLSVDTLALPFAHDERIVVYGDDENKSLQIAGRLREKGYKNAAILDGGFEAYRGAGLPMEQVTQLQPVPGTETGIPRV